MITTSRAAVALGAGLLTCGGLIAAPSSAATTPTTHITIQMFAFTPAAATTSLGSIVTWTNRDTVAHTSTSDQGFWGSPPIAPSHSWSRHFNSAGTFAYHCRIHPEMRGRIAVRMRALAQSGGGQLTWAIASGRFDVQIERPGTQRWVAFRTATTARSASFHTTRAGRYLFRARTRGAGGISGWSPSSALTVR